MNDQIGLLQLLAGLLQPHDPGPFLNPPQGQTGLWGAGPQQMGITQSIVPFPTQGAFNPQARALSTLASAMGNQGGFRGMEPIPGPRAPFTLGGPSMARAGMSDTNLPQYLFREPGATEYRNYLAPNLTRTGGRTEALGLLQTLLEPVLGPDLTMRLLFR